MKNFLLICICVLFGMSSFAQSKIIYEEIQSSRLDEFRRLKIQLPRDYEENLDKSYPIVIVLDANYLFEPVAGNVDYFSYWEDMPESIVVGIMQGDKRYDDCYYDETNFMPAETGANFFEFIGLELIPYIDQTFRTAKFTIAVGHDFTSNFINYYLFKEPPLFNGYINLSPDLAPLMDERIPERVLDIQNKTFYYLATGSDDIQDLREITEMLDISLKSVDNDNFDYSFDNFEGATHYSLVARAIPSALEKMFSIYRPISQEEYKEVILKLDTPISQYLVEKYATIEDLFGLSNPIRVNDYLATLKAAEKRKQWESLREIATMATRDYPETVLGPYYLGRYYEEVGEPKKAMRTFQAAYDKEEVEFITIDLMLDKADQIKADFGY